ncbi:cytochrome P450 [Schizopora paradoxa]|uniref:Cytochrome P450 n=1 Tax=Schizopora paradoxa TaxID=27342 RepID=A0A0H2REA9_9AGAM|nr:cytochrome P450 [Schizopora paradoxa]
MGARQVCYICRALRQMTARYAPTYSPRASTGFVAVSLLVAGILRRRFAQPKQLPCPPGPKRLPLIGNFLQLLSKPLYKVSVEWGKEYGDLIYLESFGQKILIINSYEHARNLLDRRSSIYSSRPHTIMANDAEDWAWLTTFIPYGDIFKRHRSYQQRFLGSYHAVDYREIQLRETLGLLKAILRDPEEYGTHVESLPGSVILMNVYGHKVEKNDRYVQIAKLGANYSGDAEGYMFLDVFPWLQYLPEWFPWVDFPRVAREAREISYAMRYEPYRDAKKKFERGDLKECMTSVYLGENTREDGSLVDEDVFLAAIGTLYMGGVETSVSGIMTFFLQMLQNPEVQRAAQKEIDEVVGTDRLPTFDDIDALPYVHGVCFEVFRLAAIIPLIVPHYTTEEDVYQGYRIPAGTSVITNAWAMANNPDYFPEPLKFRPERWLPQSDAKIVQGPRPNDFIFGFGRRACPGQEWAERLIFIVTASILATFNIERAIGEDGSPIAPNEEYSLGFIRQLRQSKCKITPRSPKAASLIENSFQ